jgi:DNA-binding NtrC family response regulator
VATAWRTREVQALREAVQRHRGTRAELVRQLGMSERTLYRKLKALGLASTGGSDRP